MTKGLVSTESLKNRGRNEDSMLRSRRKEFSKGCKMEQKNVMHYLFQEKWRKAMKASKPVRRAETGATSIPMK